MYEIQSAWKVNNPFTELTEREMEVLRLILDGLSNTNIANQLVINEKTVKGHVSNILGNFIWLTAPRQWFTPGVQELSVLIHNAKRMFR